MSIQIKELTGELFIETANMITELTQLKRKSNERKSNQHHHQQSISALTKWCHEGTLYNILHDGKPIGFFYIKFSNDMAFLEDVYIRKEYLNDGINKKAFKKLDQTLKSKHVSSLFIEVSPKNNRLLHFYRDCGFDHLSQLQLRKNYNDHLNRHENIEILGHDFKR